jgi:PKD repeat protein
MKKNVLSIVILIACLINAYMIIPVHGLPLGNNFTSSMGKISFSAVLPDSPQNCTAYKITSGINDTAHFSVEELVKIRDNITSEVDASQVARQVLDSYGGLPDDAILVYNATEYLETINLSSGEIEEQYPISTNVQYTRSLNEGPVVGEGAFINIELGENGELLYLNKVWRSVTPDGKISIQPVTTAIEKLHHGEVLNPKSYPYDVNITRMRLGYYEKGRNQSQEYLDPAWLFRGTTENGDPIQFYVYARHFVNFTASSPNISTFQTVQFTDTSETTPTKWFWEFGDGTNSTEQNPAHLYRTAGNFTVNLTAWNDMGSDTEVKTGYITVNFQKPFNADFNATPVNASIGDTIRFYDASDSLTNKWYWEFGDGKNSTIRNPTHIYTASGNYTVNLTAWNTNGNDTRSIENYIRIFPDPKPVAAFTTNYTEWAHFSPLTIQFTDQSQVYSGNISSWFWSFSDGTNSTEQNPVHTITYTGLQGSFYEDSVTTLTVTDQFGRTSTTSNDLYVDRSFVVDLKGDPTSGSSPLLVNFTDTSEGFLIEHTGMFVWDFGDGTTYSWMNGDDGTPPTNISHEYSLPGNYSVSLSHEIGDVGWYGTFKQDYIVVRNVTTLPVADFTANITEGKSPLVVAFTDTSVNASAGWNWDFGDSTTSTEQNPVHEYTVPGRYTVSLRVMNEDGSDEETKIDYITVLMELPEMTISPPDPVPPGANFTAVPVSGKEPLTVAFNDTSSGYPVSWSWSFGDGEASIEKDPVHTYLSAGTYTVDLMVTNPYGDNTTTRIDYITVIPVSPPVADFTANTSSGTVPFAVAFTDTSTGSPASWRWMFGDGGTSVEQNPVYVYTTTGQFTVTLEVTNEDGSNTTTKEQFITGSTLILPVAEFTANTTSGDAPLAVGFTDQSTGSPVSWQWAFGDGATSDEQNPEHLYTNAGTYTVSLEVTNPDGSNTATKTDYITVTSTAQPPIAGFTGKPTCGKAPLSVKFNDTSTGSPTGWFWDFGDGTNATEQNPVHVYTTAGKYTVSLKATNAGGSNTGTRKDYITVSGSGGKPPVADFSGKPTTGKAPLSVKFRDSSSGSPITWYWEFGDGTTATDKNPVHSYTNPGKYTVSLTVTNGAGSDTKTRTGYITVKGTPPPSADFYGKPTSGKAPLNVRFTDTSTGSPTSWYWEFGDGTTATDKNPVHKYTSAGKYTVSLTASNAGGNTTKTRTRYITVSGAGPTPTPTHTCTTKPTTTPTPTCTQSQCEPHEVPLITGTTENGKIRLDWDVITNPCLQGYKVVISKNNPNPKYPDDGYMFWITDRNTNHAIISSTDHYNGGDFGGYLQPGQKYYFSITAVYSDAKIAGNVVELVYPGSGTPTTTCTTKPTTTCTQNPCEPYTVPLLNGSINQDEKVRLGWDVIPNSCLQGYKVVISKNNPNPKYPDDGYMAWITDRNTNFSVIDSTMHYNGGDFGGYLQPGQRYYFSITAVYPNAKVPGNVIPLTYPAP